MKQPPKTNAIRRLEREKLPFTAVYYEGDGFMEGVRVAEKLGQNPKQVFKTLVTRGKSGTHYVFVLPVAEELNLKSAANAVQEKSVQMIHVRELTPLTGYIRGGCSPIGMKKQFRTVIDQSARDFAEIFFSGGSLGVQIRMNPDDLSTLLGAEFYPII